MLLPEVDSDREDTPSCCRHGGRSRQLDVALRKPLQLRDIVRKEDACALDLEVGTLEAGDAAAHMDSHTDHKEVEGNWVVVEVRKGKRGLGARPRVQH